MIINATVKLRVEHLGRFGGDTLRIYCSYAIDNQKKKHHIDFPFRADDLPTSNMSDFAKNYWEKASGLLKNYNEGLGRLVKQEIKKDIELNEYNRREEEYRHHLKCASRETVDFQFDSEDESE
jgi:hypothetical protein